MKHKRFMIFSFTDYYPNGGLGDVLTSVDTLEEAKKYLDENISLLSEFTTVFDRIEGVTCEIE